MEQANDRRRVRRSSADDYAASMGDVTKPFRKILRGDARDLRNLTTLTGSPASIREGCVDLVVTSPPYWRKRDYGSEGQIGQELTAEEYVAQILKAITEWRRVLRRTGSIFLNIGDTYWRKSLQGIPSLVEAEARKADFVIRNRIVWVKKGGHPDPVRDRLASRHEYILHLAVNGYYYDLFGYAEKFSARKRGANPGDVWAISPRREMGKHLAPFPAGIAERAILLACPESVCTVCGTPRRRIIERSTMDLDLARPQARRALAIAKEAGLREEHFAAIRATGISDAGKARFVQTGTDKNTDRVRKLAGEAKAALGGYFREFTFAKRRSVGWTKCDCDAPFAPGVVLDPFMGTGTTLDVAAALNRSAYGVDLDTTQATRVTDGL